MIIQCTYYEILEVLDSMTFSYLFYIHVYPVALFGSEGAVLGYFTMSAATVQRSGMIETREMTFLSTPPSMIDVTSGILLSKGGLRSQPGSRTSSLAFSYFDLTFGPTHRVKRARRRRQ